MALVFSSQGIGNLLTAVVMVVLLKIGVPLRISWRVALAIPAIPLLLTFYPRYKLSREERIKVENFEDIGLIRRRTQFEIMMILFKFDSLIFSNKFNCPIQPQKKELWFSSSWNSFHLVNFRCILLWKRNLLCHIHQASGVSFTANIRFFILSDIKKKKGYLEETHLRKKFTSFPWQH